MRSPIPREIVSPRNFVTLGPSLIQRILLGAAGVGAGAALAWILSASPTAGDDTLPGASGSDPHTGSSVGDSIIRRARRAYAAGRPIVLPGTVDAWTALRVQKPILWVVRGVMANPLFDDELSDVFETRLRDAPVPAGRAWLHKSVLKSKPASGSPMRSWEDVFRELQPDATPERPGPKPRPVPKPKPRPKPKPKPKPKPRPKPKPKPRPRPRPKPEPKPRPRPRPKPEPKPKPRPDPRPHHPWRPHPHPDPEPEIPEVPGTHGEEAIGSPTRGVVESPSWEEWPDRAPHRRTGWPEIVIEGRLEHGRPRVRLRSRLAPDSLPSKSGDEKGARRGALWALHHFVTAAWGAYTEVGDVWEILLSNLYDDRGTRLAAMGSIDPEGLVSEWIAGRVHLDAVGFVEDMVVNHFQDMAIGRLNRGITEGSLRFMGKDPYTLTVVQRLNSLRRSIAHIPEGGF